MTFSSLSKWVIDATEDKSELQLRQAIHTTLQAISVSSTLRPGMLIKGGILLAIHYGSDRYTRDIDFSTDQLHAHFDEESFMDELNSQLADAVQELGYQLDCRVQGKKLKPREGATYPTLEIRIGHAYLGSSQHMRLVKNRSTKVLKIDYSFNEHQAHEPISINIGDAGVVCAYSLPDLLGEKYRALLQQELRNRVRSQDVFDINMLLANNNLNIESDDSLRVDVHKSLVTKSNSRDIKISNVSMRDQQLKERSRTAYEELRLSVGALPDFDQTYSRVQNYFESLPWD